VRFSCAGALISAGVVSAILALPLSTTGSNPPPAEPQAIDDSQMQALSTTIGGAPPLPTARTVAHWFGTTLNPDNGVTYGYNMVGADPNNCSGSVVHDTVTIAVPSGKGTILQSGRGVHFADINIQWWSTRIQNLNNSLGYNDPTHLAVYLTKDTVNFFGQDPLNCCVRFPGLLCAAQRGYRLGAPGYSPP
jgi:hypothetical protein